MGIITNCIRYIFGANTDDTRAASIATKRKRSSEEDTIDPATVGKNSLNSALPPIKRARMDNDHMSDDGARDEVKSPLRSFVKSFKSIFIKTPNHKITPNKDHGEETSNHNHETIAPTSNIETIDLVSGKFKIFRLTSLFLFITHCFV